MTRRSSRVQGRSAPAIPPGVGVDRPGHTGESMTRPLTFEWDVLAHANLTDWLDALKSAGWFRDPSVPGVITPQGTILYAFHFVSQGEADLHG